MPERSIRLTQPLLDSLNHEATRRGLRSASTLIRTAIANELADRDSALTDAEQRIAGSLDQIARRLRQIETTQQAEFALVDALARSLFLCIPEPASEAHAEALARAKHRHKKLLKMAALSMRGDVHTALLSVVNHAD